MNTMIIVIIIGVSIGVFIGFHKLKGGRQPVDLRLPERDLPRQWRKILKDQVPFYNKLKADEKRLFEYKVHVFLLNIRIIGIQTEATDKDRMLVAASAIIPIFRFKEWHYRQLFEVQIYPEKFEIPNSDKMARGLVGWGAMQGKMMLSRKALYEGYENTDDNKNVAIHEFIHLLDKGDGKVDGVLENLIRETDITPWLYIIHKKMNEIVEGNSDIRDYGGVNTAEFLAVVGEYFFENPEKMRTEHPELYMALDSFFNPPQKVKEKYTAKGEKCPCGSGKTYRNCCQKYNISYEGL